MLPASIAIYSPPYREGAGEGPRGRGRVLFLYLKQIHEAAHVYGFLHLVGQSLQDGGMTVTMGMLEDAQQDAQATAGDVFQL